MVSRIAFSWCFCFLLSRVSSCCSCRFPSLAKIGGRSKSSSFGGGDCGCCGSSIMYYGMVKDVVVVCLSVGQSGYHHQYLFCAESLDRMGAVMV